MLFSDDCFDLLVDFAVVGGELGVGAEDGGIVMAVVLDGLGRDVEDGGA